MAWIYGLGTEDEDDEEEAGGGRRTIKGGNHCMVGQIYSVRTYFVHGWGRNYARLCVSGAPIDCFRNLACDHDTHTFSREAQ